MYRLDKTIVSASTHEELEASKKFAANVSLTERLRQAWYLTCMAYGIDPEHPPKMEKKLFSTRKHER